MLIADSEEKLQTILTTVTVESENKGLQLDAKKTECMVISKQSDCSVSNILCKGERIKQVATFKYLGFTIVPDARCDTEIKKRLALSTSKVHLHQQKYQNLHQNQHSESLHNVWSIFLHGCECWTLTKDLERRLEAAEMWYIGRIMRISWTEKKSNEEVMEIAGYKDRHSKPSEKDNYNFWAY